MNNGSQQRFSIRKYSFGVASVLIASFAFVGGQVQADSHTEVSTETASIVSNDVKATSQLESETVTGEISSETRELDSPKVDSVPSVTSASSIPSENALENNEPTTLQSSRAVENPTSSKYSSQDRSMSTVSGSLASSPQTDLPSSGTYVFQETANVQNLPELSSPVLAVYDKGQSVKYDSIVSNENRL
ncbi:MULTISPECIES: YSIRK-type signal peptide-containing protein [unclassified Streptococcus]|uniref:YSIRK-type signal peptide-containing protein n=1 Tax=unclassified Streptococcus TaxID=2608887 RepID=UPI001430AD2B|nr:MULTISPECIES: YSIRK-type signal peptide-containing protein [unclassified Streptococcus]MBF0806758.1 YSIRK-type signal peptide-containing protein [Streptococcus sp. 19428wA2_WM07]